MDTCKKVLPVIKIICFFVVFVLINAVLTPVFVDKEYQEEICGYADMEKDSIDVLLLGSSKVVTALSPMVLWHEYGIASYNIAMGGQSVSLNYYNLKSALETQSPKLLVLDVGLAFQSNPLASPARLRQWLTHSRPSLAKIDAIIHLASFREWPSHIFQMLYFHDRWKSLNERDFKKPNVYGHGARAAFSPGTLSDGLDVLPETEKSFPCGSDVSMKYFDKILTLCRKKGIEVLLINVPSQAVGKTPHGKGSKLQRKWNAFADYAEEKGVHYLNCLHHIDEIGIRFSTDYRDWAHADVLGQQKVSAFLGAYLKDHYDLPDHRGEDAYAQWDKDYQTYYKLLEKNGMLLAPDTFPY